MVSWSRGLLLALVVLGADEQRERGDELGVLGVLEVLGVRPARVRRSRRGASSAGH